MYAAIAQENKLGISHVRIVGDHTEILGPPDYDPMLVALRQIGHELIRTLERQLAGLRG